LGTFVFLFFSWSPVQAIGWESLKKAYEFVKDPKGNLFKWVGGDNGLISAGITGMNRLLIGDLEEKKEGKEEGSLSLPPTALVVPGTNYYFTGGLAQLPSQGIAMIYASPPASGVYYASTVFQKLRGQPVYAAGEGFGYNQLRGILEIWKAMRNIAYALLTIVFLFVGLAIMFRVKISPQAVLTVENALPKLIGALVLITFSYAIAGFMIDLMYVVIALVYNILPTSREAAVSLNDFVNQYGIFGFGWQFFRNILLSLSKGAPGIAIPASLTTGAFGALGGGLISTFVFGLSGGWATLPVIGGVILLFAIIYLYLIFKLWFSLLKIYFSIVISIIFSPLIILAGVLPNSPFGFGKWLKSLAANLAVFPALFALFKIAQYIVSQEKLAMWKAPIIRSGLGNGAPFLISLGLLLTLPSVPLIIKAAIEGKEVPVGKLVAGTITPVVGFVTYPAKTYLGIREKAATDKAAKDLERGARFLFLGQRRGKEKSTSKSEDKNKKGNQSNGPGTDNAGGTGGFIG